MSFDYSAIFGDLFWIDRSPGRIPRRKGEPSHHLLTLCTYIFTCYAMQYRECLKPVIHLLASYLHWHVYFLFCNTYMYMCTCPVLMLVLHHNRLCL